MSELGGIFAGNSILRRRIVGILAKLARTKPFRPKSLDVVPVAGIYRALRRSGCETRAGKCAERTDFCEHQPILAHGTDGVGDAMEKRIHIVGFYGKFAFTPMGEEPVVDRRSTILRVVGAGRLKRTLANPDRNAVRVQRF